MTDALELARHSVKEAIDDNLAGESAKVAYYFFLSFFPLVLSLFAFAGIVDGEPLFQAIMSHLTEAAPGETEQLLRELVREITGDSRPGLLSLGLFLTLWSASNIFASLADGLNTMYDLEEDRSWWKKRALALVALLVGYVLLLPGAAALVAGPELIGAVGLHDIWGYLRWPLVFLALVTVMGLAYYLLPNRDQRHTVKEELVGAVVGTSLWIAATLLFRFYVTNFGSYDRTYGFIGGVIVLLLWLYLTALTILFGGEVAATMEQCRRSGFPSESGT